MFSRKQKTTDWHTRGKKKTEEEKKETAFWRSKKSLQGFCRSLTSHREDLDVFISRKFRQSQGPTNLIDIFPVLAWMEGVKNASFYRERRNYTAMNWKGVFVLLYYGTFGCCRSNCLKLLMPCCYRLQTLGRSLRLNHGRLLLLCRAGRRVLQDQSSPPLTVLDTRVCIIQGAIEVFPFYRR